MNPGIRSMTVWSVVALLLGTAASLILWWSPAVAAEVKLPLSEGAVQWGFIAAALATGLSSLGAGIAVAAVGSAAIGTLAEKPELLGRALMFCDVTAERQVQLQMSQEATERLLGMADNWNESAEARAGLTAQELKILRLVGQGFSNPQIATKLHVAVSTVRSHLKHVYGKLGLSTRSEAISYALRNGLS